VAGGWRRLNNEELCNLYTLLSVTGNIILWMMKLAEHIACM
jgi:hypothetical protein